MDTNIIYVFIPYIVQGQNIIICDNFFLIVSIAELCNNDNNNYKVNNYLLHWCENERVFPLHYFVKLI